MEELSTYQQEKYDRVLAAIDEDDVLKSNLEKKLKHYKWSKKCEILRFLEHKNWKVKNTIPSLSSHLEWWVETRPDKLRADRFRSTEWFTLGTVRFIGTDMDDRSCAMCFPALHRADHTKTTLSETLALLCFAMERALAYSEDGKCSIIFDYAGYSVRKHFDLKMYRKGLTLLRDQYSGHMGSLFCIDMPKVVYKMFDAMHFVAGTRNQKNRRGGTHFFTHKQAVKNFPDFFDLHSLPVEYGGTLNCMTVQQKHLLFASGRLRYNSKGIAVPASPLLHDQHPGPIPSTWICCLCNQRCDVKYAKCSFCNGPRVDYNLVNFSSSSMSPHASDTDIFRTSTSAVLHHMEDVFESFEMSGVSLSIDVAQSVRQDKPLPWERIMGKESVLLDKQHPVHPRGNTYTNALMYHARWNTVPVTVRVFHINGTKRRTIADVRRKRALHTVRVISDISTRPYILCVHGAWYDARKTHAKSSRKHREKKTGGDAGELEIKKAPPIRSGTLYVVLDHVECSVHDWLNGALCSNREEISPPSWPQRLTVMIDLAHALHHLHQNDPSIELCVFSSHSTYVRRSDGGALQGAVTFGFDPLLFSVSPDTDGNQSRWLSPEAVESGNYSCASDIYALGWVLLEFITGKVPFEDVSDEAGVLECILNPDEEGLLRDIPSETPSTLRKLIPACLSRNPAERPALRRIIEKLNKLKSEYDELRMEFTISHSVPLASSSSLYSTMLDSAPESISSVSSRSPSRSKSSRRKARRRLKGKDGPASDGMLPNKLGIHPLVVDRGDYRDTHSLQPIPLVKSLPNLAISSSSSSSSLLSLSSSSSSSSTGMKEMRPQASSPPSSNQYEPAGATPSSSQAPTPQNQYESHPGAEYGHRKTTSSNKSGSGAVVMRLSDTDSVSSSSSEDEEAAEDEDPTDRQVLSATTAHQTKEKIRQRVTDYGVRLIDPKDIKMKGMLGSGSFGVVMRGKYKGIDVAVKSLRATKGVPLTDKLKNVFEHEAAIMAKVSHHPNIVQLYGILQTEDSLSFVTEFADGGGLDVLLMKKSKANRPLKVSTALQICADTAVALQFLHSEGVIHRDIAARNVLLRKGRGGQYHVLITDFGMSRLKVDEDSMGQTQSRIGPIKWMSPEAISNQHYSPASDAFAFGVLMWEVFTCREPWEGQSLMMVAMNVVRDEKTLNASDMGYRGVESLAKRCWRKDPEERPSMKSLAKSLNKLIKKEEEKGEGM